MVKKIPFNVIWDRKALDNLNQILSYLSKQSSQAPKIIRDAILTRIEIIVRDPKICEKDNLKEIPDDDFPGICCVQLSCYLSNPSEK